jgi:FMN phosphatase YigB (HAD superfamily)
MKKQIIAVDADDTIFDENTAVRLYMNEKYGFSHTADDYLVPGKFSRYWDTIWGTEGVQTDGLYDEFATSDAKKNLKPIPDALETLKLLKAKYELVIVTARDHRTVELTHTALAEHYPEIFSDVHFTPLWGNGEKVTKAKICTEIGASYLIDDCFEHCKLAAEAGIQAILFGTYGWNTYQALPSNVVRCKNWEEVKRII